MKAFAWILAGVGIGVAAYIVLNQPDPMDPTGDEDVEYAASRTSLWGSKQRITGTGNRFKGRLKEGVGRITSDDQMATEGVTDQVAGVVQDAAGKVAQAAGETIHTLNSNS